MSKLSKILSLFILIGGLSIKISACVCAEYCTPPCAAYARADAIFVGTVLEIKEEKQSGDWPTVSLQFAIDEAFKNVVGKTITVTASTGTDCSSKYEIGEQLFVYAHKDSTGKKFSIWDCDRTTVLASADEDLAYVRIAEKGRSKQTILGALQLNGYEAMRQIPVVAESGQKRYATKTDRKVATILICLPPANTQFG